ncbi:hypothetical protein K457DRAFT_1875523 [Linnemannia elongata AG-77]|uniref:Uncharacterized protein n=1 Tax=Linnemannia elongata AG-77 TaxID=1314771 RepID=A0A197JXJ7_9FUNG|nr:hypothetical protein K457DRAFT_1875523 [Linnemannia elongata AG-77]
MSPISNVLEYALSDDSCLPNSPIPSTTARTIAASSQEPPHERPPSQEPSQEQSPSQNPRQFTTTFTVMKACLFTLSALALAVQGFKVEIDKRSQTKRRVPEIGGGVGF